METEEIKIIALGQRFGILAPRPPDLDEALRRESSAGWTLREIVPRSGLLGATVGYLLVLERRRIDASPSEHETASAARPA